jgi:hypothetical protein
MSTTEEILTSCMREKTTTIHPGKNQPPIITVERRIVRVEVHGIARVACWCFVLSFFAACVYGLSQLR